LHNALLSPLDVHIPGVGGSIIFHSYRDLTGVEDVKNLLSASPIWFSLPFVDMYIVGMGGSNYFPSSYNGSNRGGGCNKPCE
jgi:hypothetical protein